MLKRTLQLLGGLLSVAALIVAPAAAPAHTTSTADQSRAGGGCQDNRPPSSRWGHGWWGRDGRGSYWRGWGDGHGDFHGRAYDPGCDALHPGKVARVMVAVERVRGSSCQRMHASGHLGPRVSCSRPHWLRAQNTRHWRYHIPKSLPQGHYRLHRRAVDSAGNREGKHTMHLRIR
jgi:hypothetical protein